MTHAEQFYGLAALSIEAAIRAIGLALSLRQNRQDTRLYAQPGTEHGCCVARLRPPSELLVFEDRIKDEVVNINVDPNVLDESWPNTVEP